MIIYSIEFYVENKFGNDHMYLKNEKDHWILSLTNTETLLPRHKASLKKAGFNFIQTFKNSWEKKLLTLQNTNVKKLFLQ